MACGFKKAMSNAAKKVSGKGKSSKPAKKGYK